MVHVMQDEKERRRHCASFQRSIRSGISDHSSLSSSHTSLILEQMCASIIAPNNSLADLFHDQQNRSDSFVSKDPISIYDDNHSKVSDDLANSLADLLPLPKTFCGRDNVKNTYGSGPVAPCNKDTSMKCNASERPLKSILRNDPSHQSPKSQHASSTHIRDDSLAGPPRRRRVYSVNSNNVKEPMAPPYPKNNDGAHSIRLSTPRVVQTKAYDGQRRGEDYSATASSKDHHTKSNDAGSQKDIKKVLENALDVDACTKVKGMPWTERISPYRKGVYSGAVDRKLRPHGVGSFDVKGQSVNEKLCGYWYKGLFTSHAHVSEEFAHAGSSKHKPHNAEGSEQKIMSDYPTLPFSVPKQARGKLCSSESQASRSKLPQEEQIRTHRKQQESQDQRQEELHAPANPGHEHLQEFHYGVGDKLRSRKDVVDRKTDEGRAHLKLISCLEPQDGAFIKRTDRSFTFATVMKRYVDPQDEEEKLVFAVNLEGATKTIPKRLWKSCIRVVKQNYHTTSDCPPDMNPVSPRCVKESINTSFPHSLPLPGRWVPCGSASSHNSSCDSVTEYWA